MNKTTHLLYVPFTGLGLYGGHRGQRWLRNRIKIFKQFVLKSLQSQTDKDFILWVSWRYEDRGDKMIVELEEYIKSLGIRTIFTYSGVCFWDDKYDDVMARQRLLEAVHGSMGEVINVIGDCENVLMTIQPSDDCYRSIAVGEIKQVFEHDKSLQVFGYKSGYVMDYMSQKLCEWNPKTTPPFYTIKFPRETFIDPLKHLLYTGPYKSHEFVKDYLKALYVDSRGFLVGTHGFNISTVFDHPYAGRECDLELLSFFGLSGVEKLVLPLSIRNIIFRKLPYGVKRKLRYWAGEKVWILRPLFSVIYNYLRA